MAHSNILTGQTREKLSEPDRPSASGRQAARELLLLSTAASLPARSKEQISRILAGTVDWRYLLELAGFHGVTPLISHNLSTNGFTGQVPQPYRQQLSQIYNITLYKNVVFSNELTRVLSVFSQHGVSAIALKGTVLSEQLYGNPALRTVVDIDVLVQSEQLPLAESTLREIGYEKMVPPEPWNHPFHKVYCRLMQFPLFIELHWNLDDPKLITVPQQEIWNRAQSLQIQGGTTMVLSPEDTLLFLCNNLIKQDEQLLRSLCDVAALLKKYNDVLDWGYIIASARSWDIVNSVYYSLVWAQSLFGAPAPSFIIRVIKPSTWHRWLLNFLVDRDIFISAIRPSKVRTETFNVVRSLMMKHTPKRLKVLSEFRGQKKGASWLRTTIWIILVFSAALGRTTVRVASGLRRKARTPHPFTNHR